LRPVGTNASVPPVGIITLEDAETGDQMKSMPPTACVHRQLHSWQARLTETMRVLRQNRIDRIELRTGDDYLPALRSFQATRRRMIVR
jgi:hypothetical protein